MRSISICELTARETEIIRESGINNESVQKFLKHRISLGIVKYPNAGEVPR